ncbi:FadR/GntR family transcriptional regulator [Ideonella livida]|uniref:FadR family transcriptional regulator n=1 Tax=Ideonella livida TaxID=2707176 RepID=A0A7C9PFQ7_9BURK|nr:FadR/GntR family transcriptional regulator [Ideonella livida]NDY90292.1 FadR family transcriptional regulator [Ideonella livida]
MLNEDPVLPRRRPRTLAQVLVGALEERIRDGRLGPGEKLPTEAAIMGEFGVSRTVVREAISRLQAAGLVSTRHGVGTFVSERIAEDTGFRIAPEQLGTLNDVIALLELRIGLETEAAALAAQRRTEDELQAMRQAIEAMEAAIASGEDAVAPDFQFHLEIAKATHNPHYVQLLSTLGSTVIPRARLDEEHPEAVQRRQTFLRRVNGEHESILDAIGAGDPEAARAAMRTHLSNSRERRRRSLVASSAD